MVDKRAWILAALLVVSSCGSADDPTPPESAPDAAISGFGKYEGYSHARFDDWVTTSEYITTRDGTRLAADISRPLKGGKAVNERFPVVWTYSRYHRRWTPRPNIDDDPILQRLVRHGYVIVSVNVRGGGASFGRYEGLFSAAETRDAYDVIDWLAKQDFSDGNVGMYGLSYMGVTQYMAASTRHPALKAVIPENGPFNLYDALRRGGILRSDMVKSWADGTRYLDKEVPPIAVSADPDGILATQAVAEHADNFDPIAPMSNARFRDSTATEFDWLTDMPSAVIDDINEFGVPIYHIGGWYDAYSLDTLLLDANYTGTDKLAMGPWAHEAFTEEEIRDRVKTWGAEFHRWYDYWLKGIDNGVLDDPAIHVALVDIPQQSWSWMPLERFPDQQDRVTLYFSDALNPSGDRVESDRPLVTQKPAEEHVREYRVDPETTTGTATRWDSNFGTPVAYPDMTANDQRALTFTTEALEDDLIVVGAPVVTLHVSASTEDADVYVLLEEVDANGVSRYVSEGMLRVSLRKQAQAPWDNLGLPWHRAYEQDRQMLESGEVVELNFPMQPTAHLFNRGNRLRVAVMGADKDNTEPPPSPDAVLSIRTGGERASSVSFPVLKERMEK